MSTTTVLQVYNNKALKASTEGTSTKEQQQEVRVQEHNASMRAGDVVLVSRMRAGAIVLVLRSNL